VNVVPAGGAVRTAPLQISFVLVLVAASSVPVPRLESLTLVASTEPARRSFRCWLRRDDLEGIAVMVVAKSKLLRRAIESFMIKVSK
jgi:hypothetical protein